MNSVDSSELKRATESELTQLGLVVDRLEAHCFDNRDWCVILSVQGRTFAIGWVHRDGWCCSEMTEGSMKDFVSPDVRVGARNDERLRKQGLATIRYAIEHPEFQGVLRPII